MESHPSSHATFSPLSPEWRLQPPMPPARHHEAEGIRGSNGDARTRGKVRGICPPFLHVVDHYGLRPLLSPPHAKGEVLGGRALRGPNRVGPSGRHSSLSLSLMEKGGSGATQPVDSGLHRFLQGLALWVWPHSLSKKGLTPVWPSSRGSRYGRRTSESPPWCESPTEGMMRNSEDNAPSSPLWRGTYGG